MLFLNKKDSTPGEAWYVYILQCSDGSLYTGVAKDVFVRLAEHNSGKGARYTRSRKPCLLRFFERHPTRSSAQAEEARIKRMSRDEKIAFLSRCPAE